MQSRCDRAAAAHATAGAGEGASIQDKLRVLMRALQNLEPVHAEPMLSLDAPVCILEVMCYEFVDNAELAFRGVQKEGRLADARKG